MAIMILPDAGEDADCALLTLSQWLSPAFPTGAFAYSHGLEWSIAAGEVRDAEGLKVWLQDVLTHGAGRSDAILLAHALRSDADLAALADLALALASSAEREREMLEQGAAFVHATNALTGQGNPVLPLPVAVGAAARELALPPRTVLALFLQAFAGNLVAIAVRFVPLGGVEGQRVLAGLRPLVSALAREAARAPLDALGTSVFRADLAAMRHETMSPRMFRT